MAAVLSSAVTLLDTFKEDKDCGKLGPAVRRVRVAMSANGGTAADMLAALFNLAEITEVSQGTLDNAGTLSQIPVIIDLDPTTKLGRGVLTCNPATGALANVTAGNLYFTVKGRSL